MSEDIERGLRGALRRATDGLTDNPDRFDEVERRVRRRRTRAVAGIAGTVVLLAAVGGFALLSQGGSGENPKTVVADDPPVDEVDLTCGRPSGGPGDPVASGPHLTPFVPDGAVGARLCPGVPEAMTAAQPDPKLLALRLHSGAVEELVSRLNALPPGRPDPNCDIVATYDLLLAYPDGKRVTVPFETGGCGLAWHDSDYRQGGNELDDLFEELAAKQKSTGPPTQPSGVTCPPPSGGVGKPKNTGDGPLVPEGAAAARLCRSLDNGHPLYVKLPPADLATVLTTNVDQLVDKVNQLPAASPNAICTMDLGPTFDLLLAYPGGKTAVVTFEMFGCGNVRSSDEYRLGGREVGTLFRELAAQQKPRSPLPIRTDCPPPSGGVGTPKDTSAGAFVRPGATSARMCSATPDGPMPGDPALLGMVATTGVDLLVGRLNELPVANPDGPCRADAGPAYDLVLGYPDGSEVVVTFDSAGCGFAQSGSEFRSGARELPELFGQLVGSADPTAPAGCPEPSGGPKQATEPGPPGELVEKGADQAQLCPGSPTDPPHDPIHSVLLRQDVSELVDKLNALPVPSGDLVCTDELGPAYDLVLSYPDDRTRVVKLQSYGCGHVESDGRFRVGGRTIGDAFRQLAERQRLATPPSQPSTLDCGKPLWAESLDEPWQQFLSYESLLPFSGQLVPQPAVAAIACRFDDPDDTSYPAASKRVPISKQQAESLRTLVNDSLSTTPTCELGSVPLDVLVFADNGGGGYTVVIGRGDCMAVQGKHAVGTASSALLGELDRLLR